MLNDELEIDEIVWGKVNGYPWWPGYVYSKSVNEVYEILFFGSFDRSIIKRKKVKHFQELKLPRSKNQKLR